MVDDDDDLSSKNEFFQQKINNLKPRPNIPSKTGQDATPPRPSVAITLPPNKNPLLQFDV